MFVSHFGSKCIWIVLVHLNCYSFHFLHTEKNVVNDKTRNEKMQKKVEKQRKKIATIWAWTNVILWRSPHYYYVLLLTVCILFSPFICSVYIHFIPFLVPFIWNHRNYSISQCRSSTDSKDSGLFWLYIFWRFPVISSKFFSIRATSSFACEYLMFILFCCFPFHFHWVSSWCDNDAKKRNVKKKWTH